MSVEIWLKAAAEKLDSAEIGTARLDALVLLEDVSGKDRSWLLAHPEFELSKARVKKLDGFIERRAGHEPLAYIRGKTEFYGREFYINHRVLEPRPESETMIELLKTLALPPSTMLVDVGTGSGALAITATLEVPTAKAIATDIDEHCLAVARKNAQTFQAEVTFLHGDLLAPLESVVASPKPVVSFAILANLPYVPDAHTINQAAMHEPRLAIFGGPDGLDVYRRFWQQIARLTYSPTYVLTESLPPQHRKLAKIAQTAGFKLKVAEDFIQVFEHTPSR